MEDKQKIEQQQTKDRNERLSAALNQLDVKSFLNTVANRIETYYVIIGCGTAAILNHTTLRQSKWGRKRIGILPVLYIGGEDPWLHYHEHAMGQPPYLLPLPGYQNQPRSGDVYGRTSRYSSRSFAGNNRKEFDRLKERYKRYKGVDWKNAWVAAIESPDKDAKGSITELEKVGLRSVKDIKGAPTTLSDMFGKEWYKGGGPHNKPRYRLLLVHPDERLEWVYARYVDICSGAGRMSVLPIKGTDPNADPPVYQQARTKYWKPPEKWEDSDKLEERKVVHGMDGLREETVWKPTDRVCVYGGGGIGLNQVERADDEGCWLDWTARNSVHDAFGLRTNDPVLKSYKQIQSDNGGHITHFMESGEGDYYPRKEIWIEGYGKDLQEEVGFRDGMQLLEGRPLYPGNSNWRIARKSTLDDVKETPDKQKVEISFTQTDGSCKICDFDGETPFDPGKKCFPYSDKYKSRNPDIARTEPHLYNRLILCTGQQQTVVGEPQMLAERFGLQNLPDQANDNMPLGLQTADANSDPSGNGSLRILGAAARVYPKFDEKAGEAQFVSLATYELTLPVSAVPPGFIRTGRSIAAANHFFEDNGLLCNDGKRRNNNVNTATKSELKQIIKDAVPGLADDKVDIIANVIFGGRMAPNNGYPDKNALEEVLKKSGDFISTKLAIVETGLGAAKDPATKQLYDKYLKGKILNKIKTLSYKIEQSLSEQDRNSIISKLRFDYPYVADYLLKDYSDDQ